ncbi:DUF2975 domain-containing protein [Streptomyces sp. NPDC047108]|uniref:DUF2975 domain-containing protein n=1 Tax=Streptomyces sp. NPDC047108 TaxID=3155025 RepID=UPI0033C12691
MLTTTPWTRLKSRTLELVIGLGLLLVLITGVVYPLDDTVGPAADGTRQFQGRTIALLPLGGSSLYQLRIPDPDITERILLILPRLAEGLLLIVALAHLFRLAQTFRTGDYFTARNTRRLRVIALTLALIGAAVPALSVVTTQLLIDGSPLMPAAWITTYYPKLSIVLLALLVAAAAEAFRRGTHLRTDTEGLV